MGIDGAIGLPAYAGAYPSTMLAHALVLNRDLQLTGRASDVLRDPPTDFGGWNAGERPTRDQAIRRQQVNVRAGHADAEVMAGLKVRGNDDVSGSLTFDRIALQTDKSLVATRMELIRITLPPRADYPNLLSRQITKVLSYADLRGERVNEILAQVVPQVAFWSAIAGLQPDRHRYTLELLGVGLRFATQIVQQFKLILNVQRPVEISPMIQPILLTPGHAAFPSGHATEASFAAELLGALRHPAADRSTFGLPVNLATGAQGKTDHAASLRTQLHRLAYRVAENRVVAGVHYPMDSVAGQVLGITLAHYFLWLATGGQFLLQTEAAVNLTGAVKPGTVDVEPCLDKPLSSPTLPLGTVTSPKPPQGSAKASDLTPVLHWLWAEACNEA